MKLGRLKGAVFLVGLLLTWELVSYAEVLESPRYFPRVSAIAATLFELVATGTLPKQLGVTVARSLAGLVLAFLIAAPLGLWVGYSKFAQETLGATIEMLRPIPPIAIIPVAILFLGIHDEMKLAVVAFGCLWPILVNTAAGVRDLDRVLTDTGRTLNLSGPRFLWEIVVKGASPYIVTGVRISLAIALILAIGCEMIAGNDGLGHFIILSQRSFEIEEMYAGLFAIAVLGYAMNHVFLLIVNRLIMPWYQGYTAQI